MDFWVILTMKFFLIRMKKKKLKMKYKLTRNRNNNVKYDGLIQKMAY